MSESEDESSGSSNEFFVSANQINLNSSFFHEKSVSKPNLKTPAKTLESSDSDEDSDDDVLEDFKPKDVDNAQSSELFSQILKNLERAKALENLREQESNSKNDGSKGDWKSESLSSEIKELLLQGESVVASSNFEKHNEEDEEEEEKPETSSEYTIPKEGVQITLPSSQILLEKKKKKTDLVTLLKNKMNQRIRSTQVLIHKVGLLWWLIHGFHLNRLANDPEILATCLSLISKNDYPKGRVDLIYVRRITTWFNKTFPLDPKQVQSVLTTESILERIREKKIYDYRELVIIYVALLRAIGLNCRLVVSLSPPHLKPKREQLFQTKKEEEEVKKEPKSEKSKDRNKKSAPKSAGTKSKQKKKEEPKKFDQEASQDGEKNTQMAARKKAAAILKKAKSEEKAESGGKSDSKSKNNLNTKSGSKVESFLGNVNSKEDENSDEDFEDFVLTKPRKSVREQKVLQKNRKLISSEEENDSSGKSGSKVKSTSANAKAKEDETIPMKLRKRISKAPVREPLTCTESDDEDSVDELVFRKSNKSLKNRKLISSEEESESEKKKTPQDVWVEVYVESEENWISVSVPTEKIHCVNKIYKRASDPVLYIVAYNSEGGVKDVTRRYCPHWLTVTRKKRVDENWWVESLAPWKEKNTALSKTEDELLLQRELEKPLPKTVGECKGHPLYALARHILKYEGLYPPDAAPLGYLKNGEAIYSRHCVHTLRSRDSWIKHARVVKPAQEAYKVVKSMPKYDKETPISRNSDLDCEIESERSLTISSPSEKKK